MIRTTVSSKTIKFILFKGCALASLGITGLLIGTVFLPLALMKTWGFLLFLTCLGLITLGLLPYRRLSMLQSKPNELRLTGADLEFWSKGQSRLIIPLKAIKQIDYVDDGIAVWVKKDKKRNILRYQSDSDLSWYQVKTNCPADYFFCYFSKRSFEELKEEWLF